MAKSGIEYFALDVDFFQDDKIQWVSARFGPIGELITIRLLCKIYRHGYFISWDEDSALLLAKSVGGDCQHTLVRDVVHELVKRGFFDKGIFDSFGILTSKGIQCRYLDAVIRRKNVEIITDYLLTKPTPNCDCAQLPPSCIHDVYVEDTSCTRDVPKVTKVKESKGKESNQSKDAALPDAEFGNVRLKPSERATLETKYTPELARQMIETLSLYKYSSGRQYKSDYHAILSWVVEKVTTHQNKASPQKVDVFRQLQQMAEEAKSSGL